MRLLSALDSDSDSASADPVRRLVIVRLLSSAATGVSYIAKRPRTAEKKLAFMKVRHANSPGYRGKG